MMNKLPYIVLLTLLFSALNAQTVYHPPLNIPLVLSANFGEIRPNHFHMGVDLKTNGREGLPLFSIDEGYVSRIKTSPFGYGKVVYINHPNDITSVYAHCSYFEGKIDSLVRLIQREQETTEIDLYLAPGELPIKKGERFAKSGNTGSSTAPHLHFELRDTKTEEALNPLVYGFNIRDHQKPVINSVKLYVVDENGYPIPGKAQSLPVEKVGKLNSLKGGGFTLKSDCCSANQHIGLAINGIDTYDGAANHCGLYETNLLRGNSYVFGQRIDRISFDDTRYVNTHTDYEDYKASKQKYHKAFRSKNNPLTIYEGKNLGLLSILPGDSLALTFVAKDVQKNTSKVHFFVKRNSGIIPKKTDYFSTKDYLFPDSSYSISTPYFQISADVYTFYYPTKKNISLNRIFSFGDPQVPIQRAIKVAMKLPETGESTYYIEVITRNGNKEALQPYRIEDWIHSESMYLGTFTLKLDKIPPAISPLNFNPTENLSSKQLLTFRAAEKESGIKAYTAFIDGKWVPIEYESKGSYLLVEIPKSEKGKRVNLRVECEDYCGNTGVWDMIIGL